MAQKTQAQLDEEDGFIRGSHGVPFDHELRAMPDIELYDALASAKHGTTAYMVIEAEKRRRDALQAGSNVSANPPNDVHNPDQIALKKGAQPEEKFEEDHPSWDNTWYGKVLIGLLVFAIGYLVTHFV